jgi:hypothetical protein
MHRETGAVVTKDGLGACVKQGMRNCVGPVQRELVRTAFGVMPQPRCG